MPKSTIKTKLDTLDRLEAEDISVDELIDMSLIRSSKMTPGGKSNKSKASIAIKKSSKA